MLKSQETMDKFEEFILRNKEQFNVYTPSEKVESKITYRKSHNVLLLRKFMRNAAAILLIFSASYVFHFFYPLDEVYSAIFDSENHIEKAYPELYEAKQFYSKQVNYKMQEVSKHIIIYPGIAQELDYEFHELDSVYLSLKKDLKEDISNKEVVNAMIDNYKLKLQMLEDILLRLETLEDKEENPISSNKESYEI